MKRVFIIYGGTGDLARKKLFPNLQKIFLKNRDSLSRVIALGRNVGVLDEYLKSLDGEFVSIVETAEFDVTRKEDYLALADRIGDLPKAELIFYLALPPQLFETAIVNTGQMLRRFSNPRKIVVEKPFGFDLESAKRLNFQLKRYFTEQEIYRIDHFLGKFAVQNILSARFSNYIFEGIWNKNFIDNVQISALETVGLEGRVSYYDRVGALRDMIQNHLLQILCFVAMEPPAVWHAERIRDEKVKVLNSIRRIKEEEVPNFAVRGVYRGYYEELGKRSNTETFACLKLFIDNFRWEGVPFYLRTGKKLKEKRTQVAVVFKRVPDNFGKILGCSPKANRMIFEIAPENKVRISLQMISGEGIMSCPLERTFDLALEEKTPDAYETLLEDIFNGDQTLFIREDESELAWEIVEPVLRHWRKDGSIPVYEEGSYGPREAEEFIKRDLREWI